MYSFSWFWWPAYMVVRKRVCESVCLCGLDDYGNQMHNRNKSEKRQQRRPSQQQCSNNKNRAAQNRRPIYCSYFSFIFHYFWFWCIIVADGLSNLILQYVLVVRVNAPGSIVSVYGVSCGKKSVYRVLNIFSWSEDRCCAEQTGLNTYRGISYRVIDSFIC